MRTLDVDDILKPGRDYGSLSSVTWGSNGVGFSEMGSGAVRSGAISVVGAISKHDQDDYDNGNGQRVPFTDQDLLSGLAKVHVQLDRDQRLSFGTVLYDNDAGYVFGGFPTHIRKLTFLPSKTALVSIAICPTISPPSPAACGCSIRS